MDIGGGGGSFEATVNVPEDANPGSYEASIEVDSGASKINVPVLINVVAPTLKTEFAGENDDHLYSNSRISGIAKEDSAGEEIPSTGDWRYYYVDVPKQGRFKDPDANISMVTETDWTRVKDIYSHKEKGDVNASEVLGKPDGSYADLKPNDQITISDFKTDVVGYNVSNVKIHIRHRYNGTVPEVDSNNLSIEYRIGGRYGDYTLGVNVSENVTTSTLDVTWDEVKYRRPNWDWTKVSSIVVEAKHKVRGLPGSGELQIDSIWLEVDTKKPARIVDNKAQLTSDIDTFVYQPTTDAASSASAGLYGPNGVSETIASSGETGETNTNSSREVFITGIEAGLNVVAVRSTRMSGDEPSESLRGRAFYLDVNPTPGDINTNKLLSEKEFTVNPGMEAGRINATAVGPAQSETLHDVAIPQDEIPAEWWTSMPFSELLATKSTYHKTIDVKSALSLEISCWNEEGASDVDLGLFLDSNGNGVPELDEFVKYSGVGGSDEHIKVMNPEDGKYILVVLGYKTSDPGFIGLKISIVLAGVEGYELSKMPRQAVEPWGNGSFDLNWKFPGDAEDSAYGGVVNFGLDGTNDSVSIPLNIFLDTRPPEVRNPKPLPNQVTSDSTPPILAEFTDTVTERVKETKRVYVGDLKLGNASEDDWVKKEETVKKSYEGVGIDTSNVWIKLDQENITSYASINKGGTLSYVPKEPLEEGIHRVSLKMMDRAGNMKQSNWSFEIDTTSPTIKLSDRFSEEQNRVFTQKDIFELSGSLSRDTSDLSISVTKEDSTTTEALNISQNEFSHKINTSAEGKYEITLSAADVANNEEGRTVMVYKDTTEPDISINKPSISKDYVTSDEILVKGEVDMTNEYGDMTVFVNGVKTSVYEDGSFQHMVGFSEGENEVQVKAVDEAGNEDETSREVIKDTVKPELNWDYEVKDNSKAIVSGSVSEDATVYINGKPARLTDGEFEKSISLREGSLNEITVNAKDDAGNVVQSSKSVELRGTAGITTAALVGLIAFILAALLAGLLIGFIIIPRFFGGEEEEFAPGEEEMTFEEEREDDIGEEEIFEETPKEDTSDYEVIEEEEIIEEER